MEVTPTNLAERALNVGVLLFALVTFSSFISSITEAMTRLRKQNSVRNAQDSALRQYFGENHVPMQLVARIRQYLRQSLRARQSRKMWRDVELLWNLPGVLQMELHHVVYSRPIMRHPFFRNYGDVAPAAMRACCHKAVGELSVIPGQAVFNSGQAADRMYFLVDGMQQYIPIENMEEHDRGLQSTNSGLFGDPTATVLTEGEWITEAVLWVHWFHVGTMSSKTVSMLITLDVQELHKIMQQYMDTLAHGHKYACLFAQQVLGSGFPPSDLCIDLDLSRLIATQAFTEEESSDEEESEESQAPEAEIPQGRPRRHSLTSFTSLISGIGRP